MTYWRIGLVTATASTALLLDVLGLIFFFRSGNLALSPTAGGPYTLAFLASAMTYVGVGVALAILRPTNRLGWTLLLIALFGGFIFFAQRFGAYSILVDPAQFSEAGAFVMWLAASLHAVQGGLIVGYVPLHFPDGRLPSRRWRPVLWSLSLSVALIAVGFAFGADYLVDMPPHGNPFHSSDPILRALSTIGIALAIVTALAVVGSLIARYRGGGARLRQQIKWFAYAAGINAVVVFSILLTGAMQELGSQIIISLSFAALPVSVAVAILRHRLYDIDLLIKRTAVYGATSAAIAATFYLGLVALQSLLYPLTAGSELPVAVSTLISFALFQPVRRRIQDVVDRRFDRSRYDAARTLEAFADRLRDEVDLDAVRGDLLGAVRQTMAPAHASLWLRERAAR